MSNSTMFQEYKKDKFTISTNPALLDVDTIHLFLTKSYWVPGISKETVIKSIRHSLCFGLFDGSDQIGFGRVVTDFTRFAYLMDIFVLEAYQGQGLGTWLMECILSFPDLQKIQGILLATRDAHGFYEKFGFQKINNPEKLMKKSLDTLWTTSE